MSTNSQQTAPVKICLPHPYLTTYHLVPSSKVQEGSRLLQLRKTDEGEAQSFPQALHNDELYFGAPQPVNLETAAPTSNNTAWACAQRSPSCICTWEGISTPTVGQVWLFLYTIFTVQEEIETFRLQLQGSNAEALAHSLRLSMVAIDHPRPVTSSTGFQPIPNELLIMCNAFW